MDKGTRTYFPCLFMLTMMLFLPLTYVSPTSSISMQDDSVPLTSGRAQTTWSGVVELTESYTVNVTDELIITPCTVVKLANAARLFVDGRILVQGDSSCAVTLETINTGLHYGIQFNQSSYGRGSIVDNLSIVNSMYGVTIYGSNPALNNVTVVNPSRVAVDLFSSATPTIRDLVVDQAGRGFSYADWRYGIGLSVGAGSAPVVERAVLSDMRIRGLNIWGDSGGIFSGVTIDNVTAEGALAISAGVWVEDSRPLITNVSVDKSDYGMLIRHIDDGGYTRAVVRDCLITNSMYRGIYVDKANHTNFTNYESADFTNTVVRGTGGPNAKTSNIGFAAIEVNATGAWFENTLIEDSTTVGLRLYFVDSSTTFRNLKIINSGDVGQGAHAAGLAIRSSFFAPTFDGLEISGSPGPGVSATSGGAMQGSNWFLHNNTEDGLFVDSSTLIIDDLHLSDNGQSGAHIFDSRYVTLSNLTAIGNGNLGLVDVEQAGLLFEKSNDIESNSGDVTCNHCTVSNSAGIGVMVKDSVDLWLNHLLVENNAPAYDPISIDNSGLTIGQQGGQVNMHDITVNTERIGTDSGPAVNINRAAANIDLILMHGNHTGLIWNGDNNGNYPSSLSRAQLSGSSCLVLTEHTSMSGSDNVITPQCSGSLTLQNSQVNWSKLTDLTQSTVINLDSFSKLHLHQPVDVAFSDAIIAPSGEIDVAWDISVWVQNNNSNGIPDAPVQLSFDQYEPNAQQNTNQDGYVTFPDFIGQRWTNIGPSTTSTVTISCSYDGQSNSSSIQLDDNKIVYCQLPLDNQAPFLYWDYPETSSVFPSSSAVEFNATRSWDLDDDELIWEWTSSLDGVIGNTAVFVVNNGSTSQLLSDGVHQITARLCDEKDNCVQETRTIELSNLVPVVFVDFTPGLNSLNELLVPRTGTLVVNLTGTYDPEGDELNCWISTSYGLSYPDQTTSPSSCEDLIEYTFPLNSDSTEMAPPSDTFTLLVNVDDGVNPTVSLTYDTILYNEIPEPTFTVIREDNYSQNTVTLDGSQTIDPEGDNLAVEFYSSLDGVLQWSDEPSGNVWQGFLSRGIHTIEMRVTDDALENNNIYKTSSTLVTVLNSAPIAMIKSPTQSDVYDSSDLVILSANGSGDFDSVCSTFNDIGFWHCSNNEPAQGSEYLQVSWTSNLDGRLSSTNQEGLYHAERLSSGLHTITLEIDDGINPPVSDTTMVEVSKSPPVLELSTPDTSKFYHSADYIFWNAVNSIDYDGDSFTMTVSSNLHNEPILESVDPSITHMSKLIAGTHEITIVLTDSDGMERVETIAISVNPSAPSVLIESPNEGESFIGGSEIILDESSTDADFDIVFRQWEIIDKSTGNTAFTSSSSSDSLILAPGEYLVTLTVRDSITNIATDSRDIRVENTDPVLDSNTLIVDPGELISGKLTRVDVSVVLSDPDGTTQDVSATIIHGIQVWNFDLQDLDGDGQWEGYVEVNPEKSGRPSLKITATDGQGDSATISQVSRTIVVNNAEEAKTNVAFVAGSGAFIILILLTSIMIARRRRIRLEDELIESWDAFREPKRASEAELEGGAVDASREVENDVWSKLEQEEGLS
ncbi:MAG: right-handed parallel beta-helix repeat-containing protein [Candidatus Thermoplasmatota archaeon]|nr:right-handed parallel beta-helix repeat-containing protein [Candidatus Thermoplasmatota archaeon]